jgi:ATP-dependent DNA helicase RecG
VENLLQRADFQLPETLNAELITWLGGGSRTEAFRQIHAPKGQRSLDGARHRLKFEELFFIQLQLLRQKQLMQHTVRGQRFEHVGDLLNGFYADHLPFTLTAAQKRVVKEIRKDMGSGRQMNRLLQGDVGSGKTLVSLLSMLIALDNGFQAAMMAPTEILAQQHYGTLSRFLEKMPLRVRLLTGSTKSAERRSIIQALNAGEIDILVGTHALLEDPVRFDPADARHDALW